jgi:trans-aconitate methyltransferase
MADLKAKDYWNKRYTQGVYGSGYGSYGVQLKKKLKWLKGLPIKSITEIGCGDFNFGDNLLKLYPNVTYTGYDISDHIVEVNKKVYPQFNFTNKFPPFGADLTLCVDVLFHVLDDNEYTVLLINLKQALRFGKYLAITAYEQPQTTADHLKVRVFDPAYFGKPIIRKVVEEDGQLYFYLFKK